MENTPPEDKAPKEDQCWYRKTKRGWVKEKETKGHEKKGGRVQSNSENGGGDRLGRNDRDNFEDCAQSSATQTESSSRTSRSASPSNAPASLASVGDLSDQKEKKKKRKNHKRKTAQRQVPFSLDALHAAIREAKAKYGGDPSNQLQSVAEVFIRQFHNSEIPFEKILQEQPLHKVH